MTPSESLTGLEDGVGVAAPIFSAALVDLKALCGFGS